MTICYAETDPYARTSPTGSAVYSTPPGIETTQTPTGVSVSDIGNPALRRAVEVFEQALCRDLGLWLTRASLLQDIRASARWQGGKAATWVFALTNPYRVSAASANCLAWVASTGNLLSERPYWGSVVPAGGAVLSWADVSASMFTVTTPVSFPAGPGWFTDPLRFGHQSPPAVAAVEDIADWFGISVADALSASGIAKRTYQAWKRTGTRRPRPASEGRLWELHQLAEDLAETKGLPGLRHWLAEKPDRRELLRAGAIHELASQAYAAVTDARPAWVGVGNLDTHETPRRTVTLRPMDPGDVVEPG